MLKEQKQNRSSSVRANFPDSVNAATGAVWLILGNAPTNKPVTTKIEGIDVGGEYGGDNPNDNSGVIRYVRIEYPGIVISLNNEINGLTHRRSWTRNETGICSGEQFRRRCIRILRRYRQREISCCCWHHR
jgi:hypothetical protein